MKRKALSGPPTVIIGYSGLGYTVVNVLRKSGKVVRAYCARNEEEHNPCRLSYIGSEGVLKNLGVLEVFISEEETQRRERVYHKIKNNNNIILLNVIDPSAIIGMSVKTGDGIYMGSYVVIQPFSVLGNCVFCHSNALVSSRAEISDYVSIGAGVIVGGGVKIGKNAVIGARTVIAKGITIGAYAMIGPGVVIESDVPAYGVIASHPNLSVSRIRYEELNEE